MKINLDDPNLTAYALDELSGEEAAAMRKAVAESPDAQAFVEATRRLAGSVRAAFDADLEEPKPINILPLPASRSFWSDARWLSLGVAALLAICAVIAAVALSQRPLNRAHYEVAAPADVQMEMEGPAEQVAIAQERPGGRTGEGGHFDENPFVATATNPISSFSIDVGTASYADVGRFINSGSLPPRDSVRIEEMINYFSYDYSQPEGDEPFSINLEVAGCPWQAEHRLVRIGLKGHEIAREKLVTIAKEVEVEFNPAQVASYRLIGYEKRGPRNEDLNKDKADAGEIGAGHTVTALYEVVPVATSGLASPALLTVKLRYKQPDGDTSKLLERPLIDNGATFTAASADLKFAAAVAEFGMLLRKSPHKGDASLSSVVEWANAGRGPDGAGYRAGFIELVRKAQALAL